MSFTSNQIYSFGSAFVRALAIEKRTDQRRNNGLVVRATNVQGRISRNLETKTTWQGFVEKKKRRLAIKKRNENTKKKREAKRN